MEMPPWAASAIAFFAVFIFFALFVQGMMAKLPSSSLSLLSSPSSKARDVFSFWPMPKPRPPCLLEPPGEPKPRGLLALPAGLPLLPLLALPGWDLGLSPEPALLGLLPLGLPLVGLVLPLPGLAAMTAPLPGLPARPGLEPGLSMPYFASLLALEFTFCNAAVPGALAACSPRFSIALRKYLTPSPMPSHKYFRRRVTSFLKSEELRPFMTAARAT
mmetsp:Transcript_108718/g.232328  ORF Transcript_108718/g.232328 Transcript_108718/m.232328 type:complete len:217 (-) Transcript_108718:664-1314(-)